jgi:hypothetical protein
MISALSVISSNTKNEPSAETEIWFLWKNEHWEVFMANEKKKRTSIGLPKKTYWHLYSLQTLEGDKLARIVNKILKQEYVLIK